MSKDIHVIYGNQPRRMVQELLAKYNLAQELRPDMRVALKPNLVVAKRAAEGATTSPEIVAGVIEYLQANGIENISIMEGSWVGDDTKRAFRVCGYEDISRKYNVPLYDLKDDAFVVKRVGDLDIKVCKKPLEVDFLINMPVLKAHCQTLLTCALKNLKGCIPDSEKRRFHSLGLSKPIAYLGKAIPVGLTIVDALAGDLTFEEGGNPVQMDRIFIGRDPVLVDTYAAALLGYATADIEYIDMAADIGVGSAELAIAQVHEYDVNLKTGTQFRPSRQAQRLAEKVIAKDACSACYGGLIHALQRLSEANKLKSLPGPIHIGQGFRGQAIEGIGIGQCTSKCSAFVPGCPPAAIDMVEFLEKQLKRR